MQSDPIVAEIRQLREDLAARFGFDIRSIVRDAQERDATGDRVIVRRLPRRPSVAPQSESQAIASACPEIGSFLETRGWTGAREGSKRLCWASTT
jgi:hypothetical protein